MPCCYRGKILHCVYLLPFHCYPKEGCLMGYHALLEAILFHIRPLQLIVLGDTTCDLSSMSHVKLG